MKNLLSHVTRLNFGVFCLVLAPVAAINNRYTGTLDLYDIIYDMAMAFLLTAFGFEVRKQREKPAVKPEERP